MGDGNVLAASGSATADQLAASLVGSGLRFSLYGASLVVQIRPGATSVARADGVSRWSGSFDIDGALAGTVTGVLQVEDDGDWAFGFTSTADVATFLKTTVKPVVSSAVWSCMSEGLVPVAAKFTRPLVVIAGQSGDIVVDRRSCWFQAGINFFADLELTALEPFRTALAALPGTGPCPVLLRITWLKRAATAEWIVDGTTAANTAIIPKLLRWSGLEVYLSGSEGPPTLGIVAYFAVMTEPGPLALQGGLEYTGAGASKGAVLWAALDSAWKHPFGIRGLTITQFGAQVKIPWTGWVDGLAFRGGFTVGADALDGEVVWLIDPADPDNNVVHVHSERGLSLARLLRAVLPKSCLVDDLLAASLEDVGFYLSPRGGWVAGKFYDPGFAVSGSLDLWGFRAQLSGRADCTSGGALAGAVDRVEIRAGGAAVLALTSASGEGGPALDLELTPARQALAITGKVELFAGALSCALDGRLTATGFRFTLADQASFGIYRKVAVAYERGTFRFALTCGFSVKVKVTGASVKVGVTSAIAVEAARDRYAQDLSFTAELPQTFKVSLKAHATPLRDAKAVRELFEAQFLGDLAEELLRQLASGTAAMFEWVKANLVGEDLAAVLQWPGRAAKLFESLGVPESTIAKNLVEVFHTSAEAAVKHVADSAEEAAAMLKKDFGKSAKSVAKHLKEDWDLGKKATEKALKSAGFSSSSIDNALKSAWDTVTGWF